MPNSLIELYQLNKILNPDIYPNQPSFKKSFTESAAFLFKSQVLNNSCKEQKEFPELVNKTNELHEVLVKPFIMRRLKSGEEFKSQTKIMQKGVIDIKPLDPIASDTTIYYSLSEQQSELIKALSEVELKETSEIKKTNKAISVSTWIQQITNHPSCVFKSEKLKAHIEKKHPHLLKKIQPFDENKIEHGKLKSVVDIITKIWQETEHDKILIFTNFEHSGECLSGVIKNVFSNRSHINKVTFLSGKTKKEKRTEILEDFKKPDGPPVLVIARKLGSIGWNGTAGNRVIFFDDWWNDEDDQQCLSRAHRIGQKKPVYVYRLHNKEVDVDNRMQQFREEKKGWNELLLKGREKSVEEIIQELYSNNLSNI